MTARGYDQDLLPGMLPHRASQVDLIGIETCATPAYAHAGQQHSIAAWCGASAADLKPAYQCCVFGNVVGGCAQALADLSHLNGTEQPIRGSAGQHFLLMRLTVKQLHVALCRCWRTAMDCQVERVYCTLVHVPAGLIPILAWTCICMVGDSLPRHQDAFCKFAKADLRPACVTQV